MRNLTGAVIVCALAVAACGGQTNGPTAPTTGSGQSSSPSAGGTSDPQPGGDTTPAPPATRPAPTPAPTPPPPTTRPAPAPAPAPGEVRIEGFIAGVRGTCPTVSLSVDSVSVSTSARTTFEGAACETLKTRDKVEVTGTRTSAGALAASRVRKL